MPLLQAGLSIGSSGGVKGTLGLLVRKVDEPGNAIYGLSCAHVLATMAIDLPESDKRSLDESLRTVKQPWISSEPLVGGEFRVGRLSDEFSPLSKTALNKSDEALFLVDENAAIEKRTDIAGLGQPRDWLRTVPFGTGVHLMGAGSGGVVSGRVLPLDRQTPSDEFKLRLPRFGLREFRYFGLIRYTASTDPGDSGAILLDQATNDVVGIHVGGRGANESVYFPIHEIFGRLKLDLYRG